MCLLPKSNPLLLTCLVWVFLIVVLFENTLYLGSFFFFFLFILGLIYFCTENVGFIPFIYSYFFRWRVETRFRNILFRICQTEGKIMFQKYEQPRKIFHFFLFTIYQIYLLCLFDIIIICDVETKPLKKFKLSYKNWKTIVQ